jgi:hypothetical protein
MKRVFIIMPLMFSFCLSGIAQEGGILSFSLKPSLNIPLGDSSLRYSLGAGGDLKADYTLPFLPFTQAIVSIDYNLIPTVIQIPINTVALGAGAGVNYWPIQNLGLSASMEGGVFAALYNTFSAISGYLQVNADIAYSFVPSFSVGLGASYKHYFASTQPFFSAFAVSLGTTFHLGKEKLPRLKIINPQLDPVFPVFFKYYDDNPLGSLVLKNEEEGPISNVKVSVFVKQYMSSPKQCALLNEMKKGEEREVPLYALFTDQVLNITEKTKVQMDISVEYVSEKTAMSVKQTETLNIQNRNAMTWDDDKKVAAFVTRMDPMVLAFSKQISGLVRDNRAPAFDNNFLTAMGLHEALSLYGLTYTPDPTTPFVEFSKNKTAVDFLQFPNQTLRYKAGDCDDISILYNALLESVGIETAFITIPGHIFTAFMIDVPPDELDVRFTGNGPENFIVKDDKVWTPVEITYINEGFLKAWYKGAEEWRKAESSGAARLYPTHDSWESYEAVGFQADSGQVNLPDEKKSMALFLAEKKKFVDGEIQPLVARYQQLIKESKKDPKYVNKLGTLYAKYGLFSDAEKQFEALVTSNYVPAIMNMGNVQFLKNDIPKALTYYQKALKLQPKNAKALINSALAYIELGKYEESRKYYAQARDADPSLALKYEFIESAQENGSRGSSAAGRTTEWDE